jgi:ABC-type transport system involved in cytochrome c biogenesis permease subunit
LTKDFSVSDSENVTFFDLEEKLEKQGAPINFSYRHFMGYRDAYLQRMAPLISEERSAEGEWSTQELELFDIARVLRMKDLEKQTELLRLLPPQWQGATQQQTQAELAAAPQWYAPWRLFEEGQAAPGSLALIDILDRMVSVSDVSVFNQKQHQEWLDLSEAFYHEVERQMSTSPIIRDARYTQSALFSFLGLSLEQRLSLELFYNKARLYQWSLAGYVVSFLLALGGMIFLKAWWSRIYGMAFLLSVLAFMPHTLSIILRMMIMDRPPVATLYETIVFVGAVCVLFALILEARMKSGYALLMAGFSGAVLQFMAIRYGFVGDTMGMLVAVLNTNFWLSTHVLTITIGYGIALIAGLVAHFGVIVLMFNKAAETFKATQSEFIRMLTAVSLVALFFTTLGTILGGIWADQSWGRFWGWDPKENGALLIVLWLAFILHGRLSGFLSSRAYMISGMALCPVVALAWFGVNLLGVGLHSYGFIEGISLALGSYLAAQILLMFIAWGGVRAREKQL